MIQASSLAWVRRIAGTVVVCAVIAVACTYGITERRLSNLVGRLKSADPAVRKDALEAVARDRKMSLASLVRQAVEQEQDPDVLTSAGYALARVGERGDASRLITRAHGLPDQEARARLLLYAGRVSQRDQELVAVMAADMASGEVWRRAGGAVGLLEVGDPRGGGVLLELTGSKDPAVAMFATDELRRIAEPMAQATGRPLPWPQSDQPLGAECVAQLSDFWKNRADARLLGDVLDRLTRIDPDWREVNRLLHARERVGRWLVGSSRG